LLALSIHGSPKSGGFSSSLHNEFLKPFEDSGINVVRVYAYKSHINPCIACGNCRDKPQCIYNDDMTEIYSHIRDADFIIISSPLYFSSFPSPLKSLIDRCQLIWEERRRLHSVDRFKRGFFISTGGAEYNNMFAGVIMGVKHYFNSMGTVFSQENTLLLPGADTMDEISLDILNKTRYTGNTFLNY
jgi:multimeric flavodoxin WrbA